MRFTDERQYFVSEASVYRLLKAHDLITSPAYIVIKAADEFRDKTTAPNQLWQTDFTYLKVAGWGWYYLSTVLDDFSRFIVAWKLCATMQVTDVTETLDLALAASGLDQVTIAHRPRLLTDNGASYIAGDLAEWLDGNGMIALMSNLLDFASALPEPTINAPFFTELLSGAPTTRTWRLWSDPDGTLVTGILEATPGLWRIDYKVWEFCHFVEGRCVITEEGGVPMKFGPGDTFVCAPGLIGNWEITEKVRKHFVIRKT